MSSLFGRLRPAMDAPPRAVAAATRLKRNLIVQSLGLAMICLVGMAMMPGPAVLIWTVVAAICLFVEYRCLRAISADEPTAAAALGAPGLRVVASFLYAFAALMFIAKGGPGERLFAFAMMSASMVQVLLRYYRSPLIVSLGLAPYLLVLALVGGSLIRLAVSQGHWTMVLAPVCTVAMFAIKLWSARSQLSDSWGQLMSARERAEDREEAAQAASRAKSQFLSTMSHELRTPLNGVIGMAQALANQPLTATQREQVAVIRRSSHNLMSVLNDLLDLSKIESGSLELEVVEFDLEHLIRGVAAVYRPLAVKKGLGFDVEVAAAACGDYRGDSPRIRRILYGLMDNAVKFTDSGSVALKAAFDEGAVVLTVMDTGIGVAADDLEPMFQSFFQADGALTRRHGGAGIGLAICGQLVALMGGTIQASSRPGEGSVFAVRLPLARIEPVDERKPSPLEAEPERQAALRVLAAEDNATNQLVLRTLLAAAGIDPTIVDNGREALHAWETQDWDIILMDIQMPEMNGVDATRAIRRREAETGRPRTPIVAVTANAMTHQLAEYDAAGMDGVVPKPVDSVFLFEMMDQALSRLPPLAQNSAAA